MKSKLFIKISIPFFLIQVLGLIIITSCESNKPEQIKAIANIEDVPTLIVNNLESTILDSGIIKYKIITPVLYDFGKKDPPYMDFPEGGQVILYDKTGKVEAQIKSDYAKYLKNEKLWELKNNVEAVNQKGDVLNTEQLFLDEIHDRIYTDIFVKITTATEILTGEGLESNIDLSRYSFKKPRGTFDIQE